MDFSANENMAGCRFSLSVMSDDFVSIILNALKSVDTRNIQRETDALSTTYRGKRIYVIDAVKNFFVNANDGSTHMGLEATFSRGSPEVTGEGVIIADSAGRKFPAICKAALYPLGTEDYMKHIRHAADLAKKRGLFVRDSHCAFELEGDIHELFEYFNEVMAYAETATEHCVMQVTISVNSPTKRA